MKEEKKEEVQIKALSEIEKKIALYEKELQTADSTQVEALKAEIAGLKAKIGG